MRNIITAILFGLLLAGCSPKQPSADAKRYDLTGTVVTVDKRGNMLIIKHQEIPGYMAAMTMGFVVKDAWVFDAAHPGDQVQATLVVDGGKSWIEQVVVTEKPKADPNGPAEKSTHTPDPGEAVPDFSLVNQDGKKVQLADYHGKTLAITFIYTRCPLPDYCPLMSNNFREIVKQISTDAGLKDSVRLLSISIDPEYDQPDVLREYAQRFGAGGPWSLATGKPDEIRRVAKFFGLDYWQDSGQIIHSLVTTVIDGDGKIVRVYRGNDWKPADVMEEIRNVKP